MMPRTAIFAATFVLTTVAANADPAIDDLVANRTTMAQDFLTPIADCVHRHDTSFPLFHGCGDWTSAVQGYWALAAIARVTGDKQLLASIMSDLSPSAIAAEQKLLAADLDMAMPYGRAWFLKLAIEFEEATGDDRLKVLADEVAASIIRFIGTRRIDQLSSSERSDTWPLLMLHAYGQYSDDAAMVAYIDEKVRPIHLWPCQFDADEIVGSFVPICTNWAELVGHTRTGQDGIDAIRRVLPPDKSFPPVVSPGSPKVVGLNFSRAANLWHLWLRTGERAYLVAYGDHVRQTYRHRDWWSGNYETVGRWVPQLGVLAILPLFTAELK